MADNYFNSNKLFGIGMMLSALGGQKSMDNSMNMLNMFNGFDQQGRKQDEADQKEQRAQNYLSKTGALNTPAGQTPVAPDISDRVFNDFGPAADGSQIDLMRAVGRENLLNSKLASIAKASEPVKIGAGETSGHYIGGKFVPDYTAPVKMEPTELARLRADFDAGRIDKPTYDAALAKATRDTTPDKTTFQQMTPAQVAQWGLPIGTTAVIGSNGKPEVIGKPGAQDLLTEFGVTPDSSPDEIRDRLLTTNKGKNLVTQAQSVLDGKDTLQKMSARPGASDVNQLRAIVYALDPSYNPSVGQGRVEMTKQFNDLKSLNSPGSRIASASKLINHSIDLLDAAADMDNGKLNAANWGSNLTASQIASRKQQLLRAMQTSTEGVGSEFEKVMGGGVAGIEARKGIERKLNVNDSAFGTLGSVGSIAQLMEGQVAPLIDAHKKLFNRDEDLSTFTSPETVQKLNIIKGLLADSAAGKQITPAAIKAALAPLKQSGETGPQASAVPGGPAVGAVQGGYRFKGGNPADPHSWDPM